MKKISIEQIKQKIYEMHGDTISLDEETYVNTQINARFVDKEHGEWWASPKHILEGSKHRKRGVQYQKTPINVIEEKIFNLYKDIVTLDVSSYENTHKRARFIDKDYGEFWAAPKDVLSGHEHKKRGRLKAAASNTISAGEMNNRITKIHNNLVFLDESTYVNTGIKAKFVDKEYGEWWALPTDLLSGQGNPERGKVNRKASFLLKYGGHPLQNSKIALQVAKKNNETKIFTHWLTKEEVVCTAGYEIKTVNTWNNNHTDFYWQTIFFIPEDEPVIGGRTYRVDAYLPKEDKWIEIKGYFREDAKLKWEWFHRTHPNSELWDKSKLKQLGIL